MTPPLPYKDVLITTATGAAVCRPLWRSINMKRRNELFETNIASKV